jgi:hypothetical protein
MWRKTLFVSVLAAFCAGCMTAEERRAADEAKCRSYGFTKRNDAFAECMQRIDLDRRAAQRSGFDYWGRPVVVYRQVPVAVKRP